MLVHLEEVAQKDNSVLFMVIVFVRAKQPQLLFQNPSIVVSCLLTTLGFTTGCRTISTATESDPDPTRPGNPTSAASAMCRYRSLG